MLKLLHLLFLLSHSEQSVLPIPFSALLSINLPLPLLFHFFNLLLFQLIKPSTPQHLRISYTSNSIPKLTKSLSTLLSLGKWLMHLRLWLLLLLNLLQHWPQIFRICNIILILLCMVLLNMLQYKLLRLKTLIACHNTLSQWWHLKIILLTCYSLTFLASYFNLSNSDWTF